VPFSHFTSAFCRDPQGMQPDPQKLTSFWETQVPLQSLRPAGQPPQTRLLGMHSPAQTLVPSGHSALHFVPSHVALPPVGTGHATQEDPQLSGLESARQASLHR
jgi:hypothetical protein